MYDILLILFLPKAGYLNYDVSIYLSSIISFYGKINLHPYLYYNVKPDKYRIHDLIKCELRVTN